MNYDVTALIQEIKTLAKDTSLSDSLITGWLQETQDRVLGHYRLPFLETSVTPTLTIAALTYAYPTDLQSILAVMLDDGTQVTRPDYVAYREFDKCYTNPAAATAGRPVAFTDYGRLLYWNAPLDKAYDLTLRYLRSPVRLSSGAVVPDIPVEYKPILIHGVLGQVEEFRENYDLAALQLRKVEDLAEDMLQRYGARQLIRTSRATTNRHPTLNAWGDRR